MTKTEPLGAVRERVLATAGNSLLLSAMDSVDGRPRRLTRHNEEWPQLLTEHRELYEAIASGTPARAAPTP